MVQTTHPHFYNRFFLRLKFYRAKSYGDYVISTNKTKKISKFFIFFSHVLFRRQPAKGQLGPWVITIDDFLTEVETDVLIKMGGVEGFERSEDVGGNILLEKIVSNFTRIIPSHLKIFFPLNYCFWYINVKKI